MRAMELATSPSMRSALANQFFGILDGHHLGLGQELVQIHSVGSDLLLGDLDLDALGKGLPRRIGDGLARQGLVASSASTSAEPILSSFGTP